MSPAPSLETRRWALASAADRPSCSLP